MGPRRWFRFQPRGRKSQWFCLITVAFWFLFVKPLLGPSYSRPPPHYRALEERCRGPMVKAGCANKFDETIFISISLYDLGGHLAGGLWGESLLELIHLIGPENTFLSIYENDSGPEGEAALEGLKNRLRCRHSVISDAHVPLSEFPTVTLPDGSTLVKRIAYLAEMRNRALRPLNEFHNGETRYDKILFMNDVAFRPIDAAQLLFSTNAGPDGRTRYLTACGLDYLRPLIYYDTFAMRDAEGYSMGIPLFPIFSNSGRGESRAAMLAAKDAVPVSACWGGIVATEAQYVQNVNNSERAVDRIIDPADPRNVTAPVRFRHEPELFLDACECCLFLADLTQVAKRESTSPESSGTFVNPYVRVAYHHDMLVWVYWLRKWERLFTIPQAFLSRLVRLPRSNPYRSVKEGDGFLQEVWVGDKGVGRWELVPGRGRSGLFCSVRTMQTIRIGKRTRDKNWEKLEIPSGQKLTWGR